MKRLRLLIIIVLILSADANARRVALKDSLSPYHCGISRSVPAHAIGERFGGGIIFYVNDDGQHGLIAAVADQGQGIPFYNGLTRYAGTQADGVGAGEKNTKTILSTLLRDDQKGSFAARLCADYLVDLDGKKYGGWFLPSKSELNLLYEQKEVVGGFANTNYWSSTEYKSNSVWIQSFGNGHQRISNSESYANSVRAVRAF